MNVCPIYHVPSPCQEQKNRQRGISKTYYYNNLLNSITWYPYATAAKRERQLMWDLPLPALTLKQKPEIPDEPPGIFQGGNPKEPGYIQRFGWYQNTYLKTRNIFACLIFVPRFVRSYPRETDLRSARGEFTTLQMRIFDPPTLLQAHGGTNIT